MTIDFSSFFASEHGLFWLLQGAEMTAYPTPSKSCENVSENVEKRYVRLFFLPDYAIIFEQ
jgi:hypothetical protein